MYTHTHSSGSHDISRMLHKLSMAWINRRMESQNTHFLPQKHRCCRNFTQYPMYFFVLWIWKHTQSQQYDDLRIGSSQEQLHSHTSPSLFIWCSRRGRSHSVGECSVMFQYYSFITWNIVRGFTEWVQEIKDLCNLFQVFAVISWIIF